jgi:pilus assembly protein CpaE
MDLQFGCLPTYLNVTPRNGLVKALELVETLDAVALEGYVQSHQSGLDILAAAPDSVILPQDVDDARVTGLFDVLAQAYDYIIVDLPRYIETSSAAVLDRADRILVVTQQSIAHLRDTRRLMSILQNELGIAGERILVLVNRLDKKSAVSLSDIKTALEGVQTQTLPNDYRRVTESINLGVPLLELGRRTAIAKRFVDLADVVRPQAGGEPKSAHGTASFLHWLGN